MNDALEGAGGRPFTLVVCTSCETASEEVVPVLRRAVRRTSHGMMVAAGCLRALPACAGSRGLHAVVQPCTADRRPTGPAVRLGPLVTAADAEAVGVWLRTGMPGRGALPARLRADPAPRHVAHLN